MNRIYQGRVTKVEIFNEKNAEPQPLENWEEKLWQHHELFQDAVNYYVIALLALATSPSNRLHSIRSRIAQAGSEHAVWEAFRRRGATRMGMRESVAKYFCPKNPTATPEECFAAALAGNAHTNDDRGREVLDLALQELLIECDGEGAIQQKGREMLPRFCWSAYVGSYPYADDAVAKDQARQELPALLHDPATVTDLTGLTAQLRFGFFANEKPAAKPFTGQDARRKLTEALKWLTERVPPLKASEDRLGSAIAALPADVQIPAYAGGSINKDALKLRFYSYLLFRYVEQSPITFATLRDSFSKPKENAEPSGKKSAKASRSSEMRTFGDDPIKLARGSRGFVFRAFTSLSIWGADDPTKLAWKEFDIAAFKEALKALHQVEAKGEERDKERGKLQNRTGAMRGKEKWKKPAPDSKEEPPPFLAGDPRINRLEHLIDVDLREEYELSEGVPTKYGLQARTIRGFRDLRREWNKVVAPGGPYSDEKKAKLLERLRHYQKENPTVIGSVRLFEVLLEKDNWLIWQEPSDQDRATWWNNEFAADPVDALTDERQMLADIEQLREPIRFTPADPVHSRRQFYFSDVCKFTEHGEFRHEPNSQTVLVPFAVNDGKTWSLTRTRIHYSAPRFLRDGLREERGEHLEAVPFFQPMMAALAGVEPLPQDFRDCPVALMPEQLASGGRRILLNFPITIKPDKLAASIGKQALWEKQFAAFADQNFYLRWPERDGAVAKASDAASLAKAVIPWWKKLDAFRCLAIDLGQRDAGASALLDVRANHDFGKKPAREIGTTPGKKWRASVAATCLLRLPGEDAKVIRDGKWQEEFSGERGRNAETSEWNEARSLCERLALNADEILDTDPTWFSFPELNDRLLFALRRAQTHLARFQRWSWMLKSTEMVKDADGNDIERHAKICVEIAESDETDAELKQAAAERNYDEAARLAIADANQLRSNLESVLVAVANRVLPLRRRRWEWVTRDDDSKCHVLRQTVTATDTNMKKICGQRGLSMERLEQLEELRRRCQSLNRALRQTPGEKPKLGRPTRGAELPDPCPDLLEKLDEMREQRVNQTAHMILAQTLGVRLRVPQKDHAERERKDVHGEYERFREPVDFIVLEDLSRYLSSQGRARSENSRLMKWCHRAILGKLKDLCSPYGIPVVEATAAYSSRFCSRTGVAGFRAVELTPKHRHEWTWRRHFNRLAVIEKGEAKPDKERDAEAQRVKALFDTLDKINDGRREAGKQYRTLLAPTPGGPIFVPTQPNKNGARRHTIQADINAAINLGMRAIASPDCHETHVRVRTEFDKQGKLHARSETKREKARWGSAAPEILFTAHKAEQQRVSLAKESPRPNFFVDHGRVAKFDFGRIDGVRPPVASGRGLWSRVRRLEWNTVNTLNNDRLEKWQHIRALDEGAIRPARSKAEADLEEDQIPM